MSSCCPATASWDARNRPVMLRQAEASVSGHRGRCQRESGLGGIRSDGKILAEEHMESSVGSGLLKSAATAAERFNSAGSLSFHES